jgi:alpha-D-xyloside xylohydrolase
MPPLPHAPKAGEAVPLEVRHYGTAPGRFLLFDDDGETYAYERGGYRWRTLEVTASEPGIYSGTLSAVESDWPSAYGDVTWWYGIGG